MKKVLFGMAILSLSHICSAATCTTGTLASYLALGSGFCNIGPDALSNFQLLSGTSGATAISPAAITVAPGGGQFDPSLTFTTSQTASANGLLEAIFTYTISGASFNSSALSLSGSSETVDGAVTDVENYCAGGVFGPDGVSGCTGTPGPGSLLTLDGIQNTDQSGFESAYLLNVTNDFTLDGGTAGSATGGVFANSFVATPEPVTLVLGALGLSFVAGVRARKFQNQIRRQK